MLNSSPTSSSLSPCHASQNYCSRKDLHFFELIGHSWLFSFAIWLSWIIGRFFLGQSIGRFDSLVFPAALIGFILAWVFFYKRSPHVDHRLLYLHAASAFILSALFGLAALFLASTCYDVGWDGQYAHQSFVFFLAHGWNPLHEPIHSFAPLFASTHNWPWLAIGYFDGPLRGMGSLLSASLVATTGCQEAGKAINLWFLIPAFSFVVTGLRSWGVGWMQSILISLAATLSPVALPILLTYSLDSHLCTLTTSLWGLSLSIYKRPTWLRWMTFATATILLALCKMAGVGLALILGIGLAFFLALRQMKVKQNFRLIVTACIAICVSLPLLFFMIDQLDLLRTRKYEGTKLERYTAVFKKYFDPSFNISVAPFLKEYAPLERLSISLFSQTNHGNRGVLLKWPLVIHKREAVIYLKLYEAPEIGGFGPWMGAASLLSLILLILVMYHYRTVGKDSTFWVLLIALFFLSAFFLPMWLARYVPQLWLIPITLATMGSIYFKRGATLWITRLLIFVLLGNSLVILTLQSFSQRHVQHTLRRQLELLAKLPQPIQIETKEGEYAPLEVRLKQYNVRYHILSQSFKEHSESSTPRIHFLRTEDPRGPKVPVDLQHPESRKIFEEMKQIQDRLKKRWIMLDLTK